MLLIENGYMIDPKSSREGKYDILTEEGKIIDIAPNLRSALEDEVLRKCRCIDASGWLVAPGLVDVHVHFREPGFTQKEDITTGARAAAKGGYTTVVLMANTKPAVDNEETVRLVLERGKGTGIHVETCACVTMSLEGKELAPMEKLAEAGAVGFTDDGIPIMEEGFVRRAMETAKTLGMPISFHEEDTSLIVNNGIHRGKASAHFGVGGSPREAEISLVERDLAIALQTGACVNIQHVSTKEAVELIRLAKEKGQNIHAEATPHHFTLTEEALIQYGPLAKMNPPLREEEDRQAIVRGLADGTIDLIATDHAPHTLEEKAQHILKAPSGIIGLETALPLGITELVEKGHLTMMELLEKMSMNPAIMYQLDAGYLAVGGPADIILVDAKMTEQIRDFASKASNSPFIGWNLTGVVCKTICGGVVVYEREG